MRYYIKKAKEKLMYYLGRDSSSYILFYDVNKIENAQSLNDQYTVLDNRNDIGSFISGLRIENKNYLQWLQNKSQLLIANNISKEGAPRGWIHFNVEKSISSFNIKLTRRTAWFGPDFVPLKLRGQGYHSDLIHQRILYVALQNNADYIFTAINTTNTASLKNYLKNDFQIVALLQSRKLLHLTFKRKLVYSNIVNNKLIID